MYYPCLTTNIISVIVAAFAIKLVMASSYTSPAVYILVAALFIVGQFLYLTHRFKPIAGTMSIAIMIISILLLRAGLGTSPFPIPTQYLLGSLIVLQIVKLPIG